MLNLIIATFFTSQYYTYTEYDAITKFVETIIDIYNNISNKIYEYSKANQTVKLSFVQQQEFSQATRCYICNKEFSLNNKKIREHNHFNGKY